MLPGQIGASTTRLDEIPKHLSFKTTPISQFNISQGRSPRGSIPVALVNMDQDPELEIIRSKPNYILCEDYTSKSYATHWQINFPAEFCSPDNNRAGFGITNALDLGTDKTMIVATGSTADCMNTRFWVIDAEAGTIETEFDLPGGPDTNKDGHWDGTYRVLGAMVVPSESEPRHALIITCDVGFDLERRGVYAVDPWTGEIFWEFLPGSLITGDQSQIVDLDGDGNLEILLISRSPHNLHGRMVNGYSDDRPYLFALNAEGSLIWVRELDSEPCSTYLQTGDLDGDGSLEIVITMQSIYEKSGSVSVWDSQGQRLAELVTDYHLIHCVLMPSDQENHLDIITGNRFSTILRISFENQQLALQHEATNKQGISILGLLDLPGRPGETGLLTQDRGGLGRVLDRNFNILASFEDKDKRSSRNAVMANRDGASSFILIGSPFGSFTLEPHPLAQVNFITRHFENPRVLVLFGLGLGIILALFYKRTVSGKLEKGHLHEQLISDCPSQLQERRLRLLEDLEVSGHGAMAPLRSLRRLIWMLDALQTGVGLNTNLVARMKEIWQDCHDDALPRLSSILERGRTAQVSDSVVNESLQSIARINSALVHLNNENFNTESVNRHLANLHKEEKATEALLQSLRQQVGDHFRTPLVEVMKKVLRANQVSLMENKIQVQKGLVAMTESGTEGSTELPLEALDCRMDTSELGFILDNLVDNACRAMSSSPQRKLLITWHPVNGMVRIDVADTGIGIATEDHQRVLESGFSSRPGGGLGLPKSQRILRKYGGHLSIKRSKPGQGTTFSLVVPRA